MNVQQIRDEITKIDALLVQVESDIAKARADQLDNPSAIEKEYRTIISSLSNIPPSTPFGALGSGDTEMVDESSAVAAPDAFTFFGLVQAFVDDAVVIKCLASVFGDVTGVTPTQLEDSLAIVERVLDRDSRADLLNAIVKRIAVLARDGSHAHIVAVACELLQKKPGAVNTSLMELASAWSVDGLDVALHARVALIYFLAEVHGCYGDISTLTDVVVQKAVSAVEAGSPSVVSLRVAFMILRLMSRTGKSFTPFPTWINYLEKCLLASSDNTGALTRPTDLHCLVCVVAHNKSLSHSGLRNLMIEKLTTSTGIPSAVEVEGTLDALLEMRATSDKVMSDIVAIKKRISAISFRSHLWELVHFLIETGDKSTGSVITRSIVDRRDLFIPTEVEPDVSLLVGVLHLAAISSTVSGTIIPESIILLKKYSQAVIGFLTQQGRIELVHQLFAVLLPTVNLTSIDIPVVAPVDSFEASADFERVVRVLGLLGHSPVAFGDNRDAFTVCASVDGLRTDIAFIEQKICILIEQEAIYSVSGKHYAVTGPTNLKANILAHKKGFKVIIVVPQMYPDDKSLLNLLTSPLSKVSVNSVISVESGAAIELVNNQKVQKIQLKTKSEVEIARSLFHILRSSVHVQHLSLSGVVAGNHFLTQVLSEFLATYIVKFKHDLRVDMLDSRYAVDSILKVLESVNSAGNASGGFGAVELRIACPHPAAVMETFNNLHRNSVVRVALGVPQTPEKNTIYLS